MEKKLAPKMCGISVVFDILPKVNNNPLGENSLNLVTLLPGQGRGAKPGSFAFVFISSTLRPWLQKVSRLKMART
jgi:hypothetical protein